MATRPPATPIGSSASITWSSASGRRIASSAFAHPRGDVPDQLTRLKAVEASAANFDGEVLLMDTAPAAVLGALLDPAVSAHQQSIVCNVGNFHTLAFRLGPDGIAGVFEHHTGEITREQLDGFIARMMTGSLEHREVFDTMGHGALMFDRAPVTDRFVAVVGPRRSLLRDSTHQPYFAVPLGDMMIAGCFGLLRAYADRFPGICRRDSRLAARLDQTGGVGDGVASPLQPLLADFARAHIGRGGRGVRFILQCVMGCARL